jgi:spore coat protein U-like protein
MKVLAVAPMVAGMALLGVPSADAATQTSSFNVTATVNAACTIASTAVNFGVYSPAAVKTGDGTVTINCTNGATVFVTLDQGQSPAAGSSDAAPDRQMSDGGTGVLGYNLSNVGYGGANWNNTTGVARTGTGADDVLNVFGQIPAGQTVLSGSYSDTIVATVNF